MHRPKPAAAAAAAWLALLLVLAALPGQALGACTQNLQKNGVKLWPDYGAYVNLETPFQDCKYTGNQKCPSCSLYTDYVSQATGPFGYIAGPGWNPDKVPDVSQPAYDHVLVLPSKPCTGVEMWRSNNCLREDIWDEIWIKVLTTNQLKTTKAMAVNPTQHRTKHQLHVHVANVDPGLQKYLQSAKVDAEDWQPASCTGVPLACTNSKFPWPTSGMRVRCKSVNTGRGPSEAMPFETGYGTYDIVAQTLAATLVYSPRPNVYCIAQAVDRPSECMIKCSSECQSKLGKACPGA